MKMVYLESGYVAPLEAAGPTRCHICHVDLYEALCDMMRVLKCPSRNKYPDWAALDTSVVHYKKKHWAEMEQVL